MPVLTKVIDIIYMFILKSHICQCYDKKTIYLLCCLIMYSTAASCVIYFEADDNNNMTLNTNCYVRKLTHFKVLYIIIESPFKVYLQ